MKHERFPSAAQALLLVVALVLLEVLVGALLSDLRVALALDTNELEALTVLLANGLLLSTLLHLKSMSYRELFDPARAPWLPMLLLGLPVLATVPLLVLAGSALSDLLTAWWPLSAWEEQVFERMAAPHPAAVLMVCVLAPLLEEMLFRGVILRAFLQQYPRPMAIAASAMVFGAAHLNVYQFCIAFGLGLFAGWLYERARSLLPCIVLHAGYNGAISWLELRDPAGTSDDPAGFGPMAWAAAAGLALGGGLVLQRLMRARPASR